ncbi:acyltransferase family protein [Dysgonomonas sp. 511]|uniref:acyltransferase family protein n=1 Tax=Dysgonomonas sp. 511 TaxID=2302930 RepID=UPI0013D7534F|nr:acyltransferase family protein [Dysgonomonas sp. 511]NDV78384.1 hypothetical protein [Dysgonomonas sp. 511]
MEQLSRYRAQLMGIAILSILLYHIPHEWYHVDFPLSLIKHYFYFGSDTFLFLSGFGVYFAYTKRRNNLKEFYLRRIRRILPYVYPVILVTGIALFYLGEVNLFEFIQIITLFDYLIAGFLYNWFVPVILFFYLISPLLIKFLSKKSFS